MSPAQRLYILLAICASFAFGTAMADNFTPHPSIGGHTVPASTHCVEDNVLRLTPSGVQCADGGK